MKTKFSSVRKRDGRVLPFDRQKIFNAVYRAMQATGEGNLSQDPGHVADRVVKELEKKFPSDHIPHIEEIQDMVEESLILSDFPKVAKSYILYRNERAQVREKTKDIPEHVKRLTEESKKYFRNTLGEFIYYRTYSRWIEEEGRRETWIETVDRFIGFMKENLRDGLGDKEYGEIREGILKQEAMPSMRLLQFAGPAARKSNVCAYNCSFIAPSRVKDFAELMIVSMSGTGVGFSVESKNIQRLPIVKRQTGKKINFVIEDSREGWASALEFGMKNWFEGIDVIFDFSQLRPAGARLKTMGGKSSGPDPLRDILNFTKNKILSRQGKRITNINAHDIICKIADGVVAGGVRRSALISLSDLDDVEMRDAKKGQFYYSDSQRSLANNSAAYEQKPTSEEFLEEWLALTKSRSGERGIFNRSGLKGTFPERRKKLSRIWWEKFGVNPCGEILLRPSEFCNLTEVVARPEDTEKTLLNKIRLATIIGTYQSTLTYFPNLSKAWKRNCDEERLLGVSITGQWDSPVLRRPNVLKKLKNEAIRVNKMYAKKFGINPSAAITCVKPSGNLSQTVDCSSGMHPRHSPYYIRRVRISATDSLFKMLKEQGVPYHPEVGQTMDSATTFVIDFPVKAPAGSVFKNDLTALEQLEYWKMWKENYTEHNPSVTISVGDDEWILVANWLYNHWDIIGGLSFLPRSEHIYKLAPYEEIDETTYLALAQKYEKVDFSKIVVYEQEDETEVKRELACVAGVCEIELPPIAVPVKSEAEVNKVTPTEA